MILNNRIRVQYKIIKKTGFLFVLSNIRENIENYNKKENEKENITSHQNQINTKRKHTRKPRIRIPERTINISER